MSKYKTVGDRLPKHEALLKATGKALYTDDIVLPDMAYGMIIRSKHAHAKIVEIDMAEAEKEEGFLTAILPNELSSIKFNCSGNPPSALLYKDENILTDHPLCVGDRIMAIAGNSYEACERIVKKIKIKYEVLESYFTMKDSLKDGASPIQPCLSDTNIINKREVIQGDVQKGFEESDYLFEESYYAPAMQHVAMEPTTCICDFSNGKKLTIWSNSQTPFQERRILAEIFNMNENDIRIIKPAMGGGFGARQQLHNQHIASLLSKKAKMPIKVVNTREEEMYASVVRHEVYTNIKIGVTKDGYIKSFKTDFYLNAGPYTTHSPTVVAAASRKLQYNVPNYMFEGYTVLTNNVIAGAFRGYGNAQLTLGREILLNKIARELKIDPIEFRLKNHVKVGEKFPAATSSVTSCEIEKCAKKCLEIKNEIDAEEGLINNHNIKQAWGIAFSCHGSGPSNKDGMSSAVILTNDDGSINLMIGSADIGQGSETILSQIAAEVLGIEFEKVNVIAADTNITPYDTGTFGSSQTYVSGNAVVKASKNVIQNLIKALKHYYDGAEVIYKDKKYYINSTNEEFTFEQALKKVSSGMKGNVIIGSSSFKAQESPNPFAVCFAKVEYERKTNSIKLKHIIEAVDVGTAINPQLVEGQIEGGVAQGLGYALTERIEHNKIAQKTTSADLLTYKIPLMGDMPQIHSYIVESYEPTGPIGAKSVGELATVPVAPAIVDAVVNATGQEINKLPLSDLFMIKPNRY